MGYVCFLSWKYVRSMDLNLYVGMMHKTDTGRTYKHVSNALWEMKLVHALTATDAIWYVISDNDTNFF